MAEKNLPAVVKSSRKIPAKIKGVEEKDKESNLAETQIRTNSLRRARKMSQPASSKSDFFAEMVDNAPLSGIAAIELIRNGFPAIVLKSASRFFDVPEGLIQRIAHVPASTAGRLEKRRQNIGLGPTERMHRMSAVTRYAIAVFENSSAATAWMCQPNRSLGGVAPLELMDTEPGATSVRMVLNAIETGGVV